jgi:hypothetical protein
MADFKVVESFETSHDLNEVMPNLLFCEQLPVSLFRSDNLQNITAVRMLHHDAETIG